MALINVKEEIVNSGPLNGLNFVITGTLSIKRDDFIEKIEELGGKIQKDVNKKTNFLITDDPTTETSKNKKATELGVEKISEEQFFAKFNIKANFEVK